MSARTVLVALTVLPGRPPGGRSAPGRRRRGRHPRSPEAVVDGLTFLRTLREREDPVPVLILTARSEVSDRELSHAGSVERRPFAVLGGCART